MDSTITLPSEADKRADIVREAETWRRTPFVNNAMIKGAGVGCGTLLIGVYGALGYPVPDIKTLGYFPLGWSQHTKEEKYLKILLDSGMHEVTEPVTGDVVLFKMGLAFGHSGIIIAWPRIIHAYWNRGVVFDDARNPPLGQKMKFLSFF